MPTGGRGSALLLDELLERGEPRFLDELLGFDGEPKLASLAARLYQDRRPFARATLGAYVDDGCDRPHHRPLVKRLFKLAEKAGDDELMGRFLVAFDRLRAGPGGAARFSRPTRQYLERRAWRYFRALGFRDPDRYARAIRAALARYEDAHFPTPTSFLCAWGLVHALYHGSEVLDRNPRGVRLRRGRSLDELLPAPFRPQAWLGRRDELLDLALGARSRPVRSFTIAWLRAEYADALRELPMTRVRPFLASSDEELQDFGVELLRDATGLERLGAGEWLELLHLEGPLVLPLVCELAARHLAPARIGVEACVGLAAARAAPVAELGLRFVRELAARAAVPLDALLPLAGAEVASVRVEAVGWLLERLGPDARPEQLRELVDARHADVRARALARMDAEERFADSPALWTALPESPYDDVRAHVLARLEARLPAFAPGTRRHLWATALLAVHRGGRHKPLVAGQIAARLRAHPDEAAELLPLLALAARSLRGPERRAALAAVVRAALARPELVPAIARALPELAILDDAAMARASGGGR